MIYSGYDLNYDLDLVHPKFLLQNQKNCYLYLHCADIMQNVVDERARRDLVKKMLLAQKKSDSKRRITKKNNPIVRLFIKGGSDEESSRSQSAVGKPSDHAKSKIRKMLNVRRMTGGDEIKENKLREKKRL